MRFGGIVLAALAVFAIHQASAAPVATQFSSRSAFAATLATSITDDYEKPGYRKPGLLSDADMSAVLGQTKYHTTGFPDANLVFDSAGDGNHRYCAGCNGSFVLDFTGTTLGSSHGVFGVGLDILLNDPDPRFTFVAFVTFGDSSQQSFVLPSTLGLSEFFGLTSDKGIKSIAFGGLNGERVILGNFQIDNLTIGSNTDTGPATVPEPATLALLGLPLAGLGFLRRRQRTV